MVLIPRHLVMYNLLPEKTKGEKNQSRKENSSSQSVIFNYSFFPPHIFRLLRLKVTCGEFTLVHIFSQMPLGWDTAQGSTNATLSHPISPDGNTNPTLIPGQQ